MAKKIDDIIPFVPQDIADSIYEKYVLNNKAEKPREYLGGSEIGHPCERYLWLGFHWTFKPNFPGRILRLFKFGHQAEPRFVAELRETGMEVWDVDENQEQFEVIACNGWMKGHTDGIGRYVVMDVTPFLLEFKTHNEKSFIKLWEKGVKATKFQHFAQMQIYMAGMGLTKALYFSECKNTSHVYTEWVEFDQAEYDKLIEKGNRVIYSDQPKEADCMPYDERYKCPFCDAYEVCKGERLPLKNCYTCSYCLFDRGGTLVCNNADNSAIPDDVRLVGCPSHLFNPYAMPYQAVDAEPGQWVKYELPNGASLYNVAVDGFPPIDDSTYMKVFTSDELSGMDVKND